MIENVELLPCPFCGSEEVGLLMNNFCGKPFAVACDGCNATGPVEYCPADGPWVSAQEIADKWNAVSEAVKGWRLVKTSAEQTWFIDFGCRPYVPGAGKITGRSE